MITEIKSVRQYLKWMLSDDRPEKVAFIGPSRNENNRHVIEYSKRFCKTVHVYDRDTRLGMETLHKEGVEFQYCTVDVIFEECDLSDYDLIVVFSQEKMFPVPKRHKGEFVLVFSNHPHNGNCTSWDGDLGIEVEENYLFEKYRLLTGSNIKKDGNQL